MSVEQPGSKAGVVRRDADNELRDAAVDYAKRGWMVLPLHSVKDGVCTCLKKASCASPGKHPRTINGVKDASKHPNVVANWWHRWPDSNVGIATGTWSRVFVVDVDADKGGYESLDRYERESGRISDTYAVATGGGGKHFYFECPIIGDVPNPVGFRPGIDVRGDGGYVVAPPSLHKSGRRYTVCDDQPVAKPPLDASRSGPDGVFTLLDAIRRGRRGSGGATIDCIGTGNRNSSFFRVACAMRRNGFGEDAIEAALLLENARLPEPLPDSEIADIAASSVKYPPELLQDVGGEPDDGSETLPFHTLANIASEDYRPEWLVKNFWLRGSFGMVAGAEKTLKSYLSSCVALAVASGRALFGTFPVASSGPVVVFYGEGSRHLFYRRLMHLGKLFGLSESEVKGLPIVCVDKTAAVLSGTFERTLSKALDEYKPMLVQVDPLYSYHGAEKNAANLHESSQVLTALSGPATEANAALQVINHFNKGGEKSLSLSSITQAGSREWSDSWLLLKHRTTADPDSGRFWLEGQLGSRQWGGAEYEFDVNLGPLNPDTLRHEGTPELECRRKEARNPGSSGMPGGSMADRVLEVVGANPYAFTKTELRQALGGRGTDFANVFDKLSAEKRIDFRSVARQDTLGRSQRAVVWGVIG